MKKYIGEPVCVDLFGKKELIGILVDFGSDILVLFSQNDFYYIPLFHIRAIRSLSAEEAGSLSQSNSSITLSFDEQLSVKEILQAAAKGIFIKLNVTPSHSIHGYITHVLDNYLVLFSPVYRTIFIPIHHIKFLVPYPEGFLPYGIDFTKSAVSAIPTPLAAFEDQLAKLKDSFVTVNVEEKDSINGLLLGKEAGFIELQTVNGRQVHLNIQHIKTVLPSEYKKEKYRG